MTVKAFMNVIIY